MSQNLRSMNRELYLFFHEYTVDARTCVRIKPMDENGRYTICVNYNLLAMKIRKDFEGVLSDVAEVCHTLFTPEESAIIEDIELVYNNKFVCGQKFNLSPVDDDLKIDWSKVTHPLVKQIKSNYPKTIDKLFVTKARYSR